MKIIIAFTLLFTHVLHGSNNINIFLNIDKKAFYQVMRSGKGDDVKRELELVTASTSPEKNGYEAALMIRKAGMVKLPTERLKLFKKGRLKLETAIQNDPENGEYHFLRLIIQENSPKIAKYNKDLEADKQAVKKAFKNFSPALKEIVSDYSRNSKILQPQDLS